MQTSIVWIPDFPQALVLGMHMLWLEHFVVCIEQGP